MQMPWMSRSGTHIAALAMQRETVLVRVLATTATEGRVGVDAAEEEVLGAVAVRAETSPSPLQVAAEGGAGVVVEEEAEASLVLHLPAPSKARR